MSAPGRLETYVERENRIRNDGLHTQAVEREKAMARPPTPVDTEYARHVAPWHQIRAVWQQPVTAEVDQDPAVMPIPADVAAQMAAVPNPVRALADWLHRLADDCDAHMMVPLGLMLDVQHLKTMPAFQRNEDRSGAVVTAVVRGVSAEWLRDQVEQDPARPEQDQHSA